MDEVDEELAELADLDDISNRSSACDCPAHVHDREFPLEIAKVDNNILNAKIQVEIQEYKSQAPVKTDCPDFMCGKHHRIKRCLSPGPRSSL